jgi:hypothetical protein
MVKKKEHKLQIMREAFGNPGPYSGSAKFPIKHKAKAKLLTM